MKYKSISIIVLTVVTASSLFGQMRGPKALVVDPTFQMGYIPQKSFVSHTYWVNNIGTDTLKIYKVTPTCGCTKSPLAKASVPVNDSVAVELIFDAGTRHLAQHKPTQVATNDPSSGSFEIAFDCFVYAPEDTTGPIKVVKNPIVKMTSPDDLGKSFPVVLKNISKEPLSAKLIIFPSEICSIDMPKGAIAPNATGQITVHLKSSLPEKNYTKSFTIEMSDAAKTRFTIPLRLAESLRSMENKGS